MKRWRIFLVFFILLGLVTAGTGCGRGAGPAATNPESPATAGSGNRTTVELTNTDITTIFENGSFNITNTSNETWTNVHLTLDQAYTNILNQILPRQSVTVPPADFVHNGRSIDPSFIGHGLVFEITCDLPGNREGTFFILWH